MGARSLTPKGITRLVLAFFAITAIGGCGSEDAMSREEFVASGDSVCEEYNDKFASFGEVRNLEALADQTADILDLYEEQLQRLRSLDAPSEVQGEYNEYLTTLEERNDILRRANEAAGQGDEREVVRVFEEGQQVSAQEQELARQIGFKECSFPPEPEAEEGGEGEHRHPPGKPENHEHTEP